MAAPVLARVAAALLTNEDGRKTIGWVLALLLSPLILLVVFLCCFGDGASQHNNAVVSAAFYGAELSSQIPAEYRAHITEMQEAFSLLDSATVYVNQKAEGGSLDPVQVKAVFFALCFGDNAPTRAAADRFVDCFYKTETRTRMVTVTQEDGTEELVEETYEVAVPLSMAEVYENLSTWRGRVVTDAERSNAVDIYAMVMGSMGGDTFSGDYEPGGSSPIELDASMLTDPATKNAADLVTYVTNAWNSGWGYHIKPGSLLHDRYTVGRAIGFGGFGITYIAWDNKLMQKVAIKEYMPSEYATRVPGNLTVTIYDGERYTEFMTGLQKFLDEAQRLAKFQNVPGIVRIVERFATFHYY